MGIDARIFVKFEGAPPTEKQVKQWSWEIGAAFGADKFMRSDWKDYSHHNISVEKEITGDFGDEHNVVPAENEVILEVHVWSRYYGVGYERGDLPFIIGVAQWLEAKFPGGTVYYGGDSSGVLIEPFGQKERDKLFAHFASEHGADYRKGWGPLGGQAFARHCDRCDHTMGQYGWGPNYAAFRCLGCGATTETRDNGKTWAEPEEKR